MSKLRSGPMKGRPGRPGAISRGLRSLGRSAVRRGARGGRAGVRRGRGISKTELRGFNKVSRMLARFGMVPRKMRGAKIHRTTK